MNKFLFDITVLSHSISFSMGAILMFVILLVVKRNLLDIPKTQFTASDVRAWVKKDLEIRKLNVQTRNLLDKICRNVP
jgi:hypothetical protein